MSRCKRCRNLGLIRIQYQQEDGYDVAACVCQWGQWYRTKGMLRAWADQQTPPPVHIGRLEEFFTEAELKAKVRAV